MSSAVLSKVDAPAGASRSEGAAAIVEVRGLSKIFHLDERDVVALEGVDVTIREREFVSFVGRSGCGKSTLLNIIAGLLDASTGTVEIAGQRVDRGGMAVLAPGRTASIVALEDAVLMALGGEPLGPRHIDWNFVSSSRERIDQARADWAAGRMKLPDLDDGEFVPLPAPVPGRREPEPMS